MENHEVSFTIVPYDSENLFHKQVKDSVDNLLHEDVRFTFRVAEGHATELVIENPRQAFLFNLRGGPQLWNKLKKDFWNEQITKAFEEFLRSGAVGR